MKRLCVCGSFKFKSEMEKLERLLQAGNVEFSMSKDLDAKGILGCLEKIDKADVVYVVNPGGYIGKGVSVDIGYACARKKPIYAMHQIEDPPLMNLISGVLSFQELIAFLKTRSATIRNGTP